MINQGIKNALQQELFLTYQKAARATIVNVRHEDLSAGTTHGALLNGCFGCTSIFHPIILYKTCIIDFFLKKKNISSKYHILVNFVFQIV